VVADIQEEEEKYMGLRGLALWVSEISECIKAP